MNKSDIKPILTIDFSSVEDCDKELEMLGNGLARSCNYLAESSKTNADTHQTKLMNEMDKGQHFNHTIAEEHASKFQYFEAQQVKWLQMLKVVERAGFKDQTRSHKMTATQLKALAKKGAES